jgi:hypothetical protein
LQEKGAGLIEKVGSKVKDMESADDNTVTGLATCSFFLNIYSSFERFCCLALMDVGGNVLQAASKTVSKDRESDPGAVIEVNIKLFLL